MCDHRLHVHLQQANVQSYICLPLDDATGNLYGTFCHARLLSNHLADAPVPLPTSEMPRRRL